MSITTGRGGYARDNRPHYVYRFWDKQGRALYIGMTSSPSGRIASHANQHWWRSVDHFDAEKHPDRECALLAEADQIDRHQPLHNFYHSEAAAGSRSQSGAGGVAWRKADVTP